MCPICHEEDLLQGWCRTEGCDHGFHTEHILDYLHLTGRYVCPMCNNEITALLLDDGTTLAAADLKKRFYFPPSSISFKSDHNISLFKEEAESLPLPLTAMVNEQRRVVHQAAFPTILLQLKDSKGSPCSPDAERIRVHVGHDCEGAELFNGKAMIQSGGQCTISNMVLQIPATQNVSEKDAVTLSFKVTCLGEELPCHNYTITSSVYFPEDEREVSPGLQTYREKVAAAKAEEGKAKAEPVVEEVSPTKPVKAAPQEDNRSDSNSDTNALSGTLEKERNGFVKESNRRERRKQPQSVQDGGCGGCVVA